MTFHPTAIREVETAALYRFLALGAIVGAAATQFVEWSWVVVAAAGVWAVLEWLLAEGEKREETDSSVAE